MKGSRLSEKTFELIKQMLMQGYSVKKIHQMLPAEVAVCEATIRKIDAATTYKEYCGEKEEEKPEKIIQVTPYPQTKEIVEAIGKTNILLESLFQIVKELSDSLK